MGGVVAPDSYIRICIRCAFALFALIPFFETRDRVTTRGMRIERSFSLVCVRAAVCLWRFVVMGPKIAG